MMPSVRRLMGVVSPKSSPPRRCASYAFNMLRTKTRHEYTDEKYGLQSQTRYGGVSTVTIIPGAGIGPEVMRGVKSVLTAARAPIIFEEIDMEPSADLDKCNDDFSHGLVSIRRNGVGLKGNIENHLCDPAIYSRNIVLRRNLDLYVNVVEYKTYPGVPVKHDEVIDMAVVRQNTEGEYLMLEHEPVPGVVQNMKIVTEYNSRRIARYAFEYARENERKRLMLVHRSHILPLADGMFVAMAREVAADYPDIEYSENTVAHVIKKICLNPSAFDVLLMTNLHGSITTNMMFGFIGSPALVSAKNVGDEYAVFEAAHRGKGESMRDKNIANPTAMLNAAVDMLRHLGHDYHACLIGEAVATTINVDRVHTFDLGGKASTQDVIDNVICRLDDVDCDIQEYVDDDEECGD